jgi:pimeloyl-ACP methyl ester carboxylesterase
VKRIIGRIFLWFTIALIVSLVAFVLWAENPMRAEAGPLATVDYVDNTDGVVLSPDAPNGAGLVYIAGARVEPQAYAAKLSGLVDAGYTVVIARPNLNFAIFEYRSLSVFEALAPDVETWFVGGHSLGGVKACLYAADASTEVAGLILFGSYCSADLSETELPVLTLSATKDALSTPATIADAASLLPNTATLVTIDGGNHAQFGDYGVQPGDGESTIPDATFEQQLTDALTAFMQR